MPMDKNAKVEDLADEVKTDPVAEAADAPEKTDTVAKAADAPEKTEDDIAVSGVHVAGPEEGEIDPATTAELAGNEAKAPETGATSDNNVPNPALANTRPVDGQQPPVVSTVSPPEDTTATDSGENPDETSEKAIKKVAGIKEDAEGSEGEGEGGTQVAEGSEVELNESFEIDADLRAVRRALRGTSAKVSRSGDLVTVAFESADHDAIVEALRDYIVVSEEIHAVEPEAGKSLFRALRESGFDADAIKTFSAIFEAAVNDRDSVRAAKFEQRVEEEVTRRIDIIAESVDAVVAEEIAKFVSEREKDLIALERVERAEAVFSGIKKLFEEAGFEVPEDKRGVLTEAVEEKMAAESRVAELEAKLAEQAEELSIATRNLRVREAAEKRSLSMLQRERLFRMVEDTPIEDLDEKINLICESFFSEVKPKLPEVITESKDVNPEIQATPRVVEEKRPSPYAEFLKRMNRPAVS